MIDRAPPSPRPHQRPLIVALAVLGVGAIGALDLVTGAEIGVSLLYLIPVAIAAWRLGPLAGVAISVLSAAAWYGAERWVGGGAARSVVDAWNAGIRLGFFLVTVALLFRLRELLDEQRRLVRELRHTLRQVKTLRGLLPICAWCKKVRDDEGYWGAVEAYLGRHSDLRFTHSVCPECQARLRSEMTGELPPDEGSMDGGSMDGEPR